MHNMDSDIFDNRMLFYGLNEFVVNRKVIKRIFYTKTDKERYLFKLFIYSQPFIHDNWKNNIWDYLQNDMEPSDFMNQYMLAFGSINIKKSKEQS